MASNQGNINEKAKRIEISLKYTNGDMDKAKLMASGGLLDITAIKGKFIIADKGKEVSGFFFAYFNVIEEYIAAVKSVIVSNNSLFSRIRIFDEWKSLYKNMVAYQKGDDTVNSEKFNSDMLTSFIRVDVFPDVQKENLDYLSSVIPDMIKESLGNPNVKCQIGLEQTSSLELSLMGIDIMVPAPEEEVKGEPQGVDTKPVTESPFERRLAEIESKAQYIVEGSCLLSPVRGKLIAEIVPGERIFVVLPGKDPVSQKILDAYKARNSDGSPLPVVGRVVEKVPNETTKGVILYVLVAKGIYAKLIEEENVKIQTELTASSMKGENTPEENEKNKIYNWILYAVFTLLIILLIVILSML